MPVVNTEVAAGDPTIQASGQHRGKIIFTFASGKIIERNSRAPDAAAWVNLLTILPAEVEAAEKQSELSVAWTYGMSGGDIDVYTWHENTVAEVQQYFWRRFMNFLRDASTDSDISERNNMIAVALQPLAYVNKNSNAAIRGFIDDPAWSVNDVGNAISKANALYLGVINLDHGKPELG